MSERYTKLFSLGKNLYAHGSPVIVSAGALLKDTKTQEIIAQLKFYSVSNQQIKAIKVKLILFDTAGNVLGEPVLFDYLDLCADCSSEFGQQTPIPVPQSAARSYKISVEEVVFSNQSVWTPEDTLWEPLPVQSTLESVFDDFEMIKQYRLTAGNNSEYYPLQVKDLWFCACGAINRVGKPCSVCHRSLNELHAITKEQLIHDKETRLASEKEKADEAAKARAAALAIKKEKAKKAAKLIAAVIIIAILAVFVFHAIKREFSYKAAISLRESGQFNEASQAFRQLGTYKDSSTRAQESMQALEYQAGIQYLENGKYTDAIRVFRTLGDYSDSKSQLISAYFLHAEMSLDGKHWNMVQFDYNKLVELSADEAKLDDLMLDYGVALYDDSAYETAASIFQNVKNNPDNAFYIGKCYFAEKKYEEAKKHFDSVDIESSFYKEATKFSSYCQNAIDYSSAVALCERHDYIEAQNIFKKLGKYRNSQSLAHLIEVAERTGFPGLYHCENTFLQIFYTLDADSTTLFYTAVYQDKDFETKYSDCYITENGILVVYDQHNGTLQNNKEVISIDKASYHLDKLGFSASGRNPWASSSSSTTYTTKIALQKTSTGVIETTTQTTVYYGSSSASFDTTSSRVFQIKQE